jgi:hypothetical protein
MWKSKGLAWERANVQEVATLISKRSGFCNIYCEGKERWVKINPRLKRESFERLEIKQCSGPHQFSKRFA